MQRSSVIRESVYATARFVNISTDELKSINIYCFEHFLLWLSRHFACKYELMDTVCLVFIHHYNFACIFKQKKKTSLKHIIITSNEGFSFGTSNHVKKKKN